MNNVHRRLQTSRIDLRSYGKSRINESRCSNHHNSITRLNKSNGDQYETLFGNLFDAETFYTIYGVDNGYLL